MIGRIRSERRRIARRALLLEPLEVRSLLASFTTAEDTPLVVVDPAVLIALIELPPAHGKVAAINPATGDIEPPGPPLGGGGFSYAPDPNYNGPDSFIYRVVRTAPTAETVTVSLSITPVNDAPVAINDSFNTSANGALEIASAKILSNDIDVDSNALTVMLAVGSGPKHGTLTTSASGNFVYKPNSNFVGEDRFSYFAWDGQAFSANSAMVSINVEQVNLPPEARNDKYDMLQGKTLTIAPPGVLANDGNPANRPLVAQVVANPSHGTLTFNTNGGFTYVPAADFAGAVTFTYRASDTPTTVNLPNGTTPIFSNTATVTINVRSLPDPPEARDDSYNALQDKPLTILAPGVLLNDGLIAGILLTASLVDKPTHGTVALNANGGFVYAPPTGFTGTDTFTYRASLGASNTDPSQPTPSNLATVTITVNPLNEPPKAINDQYTTSQGVELTVKAPGVLANDKGGTNDKPLYAYPATASGPAHGTVVLKPDGSFVYTPAANYNGLDSFTYRASTTPPESASPIADGSIATVTIVVKPISQLPEARDDKFVTLQNKTMTIPAPGVLANDGFLANFPLSAVLVANPAHGQLTLNANGSLTYVPATDFHGTDSFTYSATIPGTPGTDPTNSNPPLLPNVATVTITVTGVNSPPVVALNDIYTVPQDATLTVQAPGVLANDLSIAGASLTASIFDLPTHGAVTFNANGSLTYFPLAGFSGADSFTYRATAAGSNTDPSTTTTSNLATVTIHVKPLNEPPKANNDQYTTSQGVELAIKAPGVLANDKGGTNDKPLYAYPATATGPTHGTLVLKPDGSFVYTPAANYNGLDSFTYRASTTPPESASPILEGSVATVTIYVKPLILPLEAHNDAFFALQGTTLAIPAPGILLNDSVFVNHPVAAQLVGNPGHGALTLNANGGFTYVPSGDFNGSDSFTYRLTVPPTTTNAPPTDTTPIISNVATVTITVHKPINDPPIKARDDFYLALQGTTLTIQTPGVLANDGGGGTIPTTASLLNGPANGTLTLNANGSFTYIPNGDFSGFETFTYRVNDSTTPSGDPATGRTTATVTIKVFGLNAPPIARNDQYTALQGGTLTIPAPGVLANDGSLTTAQSLSAEVVTPPAHGTLVLKTDGSFTYVSNGDFLGPDSFTYRAVDKSIDPANISIATVTIVVAKPNPLHNVLRPHDVDGNLEIAPFDALLIINHLNRPRSDAEGEGGGAYYDVNGDGDVAPLDALLVINWLNASRAGSDGEGEAVLGPDGETLALLAFDAAVQAGRRKRLN